MALSLRWSLLLVAWLVSGSALVVRAAAEGGGSGAPSTAPVPQIPRDSWKDCFYNDRLIRCRDQQLADGLRIVWIDGSITTYRRRPSAAGGGSGDLVDRYGGLWRQELLIQGNSVLTHRGTGNRIMVPLRYPCRPPLKGEVGYCHP